MRLTWFGHSTVLLEVGGLRILADPLLRDRVGPLRRVAPVPAAAHALPGTVDVVLLSHLHHDHCDLPSLHRLAAPVVVAPPGSARWLDRQGIGGVTELAPWEALPVGDMTVTAVPAIHPGRREPAGPVARPVGHVVDGPDGAAWLAGDTALDPGMAELPSVTRAGVIEIAAVPVWGWGRRLGPGHLDPVAAAEAVTLAGARAAVPVHWGTLYPAGLRASMGDRITAPGPEFLRALTHRAPTAVLLPLGGSHPTPD